MTTNSFDWDEELAPETEEEVYRALLRALRRKQGFGLFFVQCTKAQGEKTTADLRRDLSQQKIEELHLQGEVVTLYDQIAEIWNEQRFDMLVIDGLEASLYAYEDTKRFSGWSSEDIYNYSWKGVPQILNHLNQQREHLRNDFPVRLVFLVPAFVVDYFIQRAADFLDWRSGLFRFPRDPKTITYDTKQFVAGGYAEYRTLASQERIAKILELKSLQEICTDIEIKIGLLFDLGLLYVVGQDYENAITSWEKALEIKPDYHRALCTHGAALHDLGRNEEAIASWEKFLEYKPDDYEAWFLRGATLSTLGRDEEAIDSYDQALKFKPDDRAAWYNRGMVLSGLGRDEEALASWEKFLEYKPDEHAAWYNRGIALSALERNEEAIASYNKVLEIKPDYYYAWSRRGDVLTDLERNEEAIASYDKALEIKPDYYYAWKKRGDALKDLERYEEAIASYDKALEIKPDYYYAWKEHGDALKDLERYEEAIASYDKALEIKPDYYYAWYNRGNALSDLGRNEEAIESYDHALKHKPDHYRTWGVRGIALAALGQYEEAIISYNRVLEINLSDNYAVYKKAACYSLQGDIQKTIEALQHAITLNPKYQELAKTDADFDLIRQDDRFRSLIGE